MKEVELAKEPKDEDDPTQLRRFAQRIAEMKWWADNPNSEKPAETRDQGEHSGSVRPQATSEDQQRPTDQEPSSEGETS
jgi:hypothetical protein